MSDINSHAYLANLISEGGYELLQATILSQLSAAIGSIASRLLYEFDSGDGNKSNLPGRKSGAKTKPRDRRDMDSYLTSMDESFFQRKYRMNKILSLGNTVPEPVVQMRYGWCMYIVIAVVKSTHINSFQLSSSLASVF